MLVRPFRTGELVTIGRCINRQPLHHRGKELRLDTADRHKLAVAGRVAPVIGRSAIEQMGLNPRLVMGSPGNLKVTWPEDLNFAEISLKTICGAIR